MVDLLGNIGNCFLYRLDYLRLANFAVLVGSHSDWRHNEHCYSQEEPVPEGATVEYPCERMLLGNLVSINKTALDDYLTLQIHEVQVFGYKSGT